MRGIRLLLPLLLAWLGGACESPPPIPADAVPQDYEIRFWDEPFIQRAVNFRGVLTVHGPREIFVDTTAYPGSMTGVVLGEWARYFNQKSPGAAEKDGLRLILHGVLEMKFWDPPNGLRIKRLGPTQ